MYPPYIKRKYLTQNFIQGNLLTGAMGEGKIQGLIYAGILCSHSPPNLDLTPQLLWSEGNDGEVTRLLSQAGPSVHQCGEQDGRPKTESVLTALLHSC